MDSLCFATQWPEIYPGREGWQWKCAPSQTRYCLLVNHIVQLIFFFKLPECIYWCAWLEILLIIKNEAVFEHVKPCN